MGPRRKLPIWFRVLMLACAPLALLWLADVSGLYRTRIIEKLDRPATVLAFDNVSLSLSDGRTVPLPDILPSPPGPFFQAAIARGVEVTPTGRVIGLIKVRRWCGNDPVREHIARVDLARLLIFTGEAAPRTPLSPGETSGRTLAGSGMDASDYARFRSWCEALDQGAAR